MEYFDAFVIALLMVCIGALMHATKPSLFNWLIKPDTDQDGNCPNCGQPVRPMKARRK